MIELLIVCELCLIQGESECQQLLILEDAGVFWDQPEGFKVPDFALEADLVLGVFCDENKLEFPIVAFVLY